MTVGPPVLPAGEPGELPETIAGRFVTLRRPLLTDVDALYEPTHGLAAATWDYMGYGPWEGPFRMREWVGGVIDSADPFWWTVEKGGTPVGMGSILHMEPDHRVAEVGHLWYVPQVQRTEVNTETVYLLLRTCFETLRCRRTEWKCDSLNQPSRDAALRLGFRFEGVSLQHRIVKGRNRDTAWYAMLDVEWPARRRALEQWLEADGATRHSMSLSELMSRETSM